MSEYNQPTDLFEAVPYYFELLVQGKVITLIGRIN